MTPTSSTSDGVAGDAKIADLARAHHQPSASNTANPSAQQATNASPVSPNGHLADRLGAERVQISPLRYPGGKRRLVPYIAALFEVNNSHPDLLVEPYAGGASVALELAATGVVEQIGLADRDPYLAAFWNTVFFDCDWLCQQVEQIDVDLDTWQHMKRARFRSQRSMALACLFLNRTSFNGSLDSRAGPIGGKAGKSSYQLDCRFPRQRLVHRLRSCERLAVQGRVAFVECASALDIVGREQLVARTSKKSVFFYLDPPFWSKSQRLYRFAFSVEDHHRLATALRYVRNPFLLSYDPAPNIKQLYRRGNLVMQTIELLYTATQRSAGYELVISNLPKLPRDTRLWRTTEEWRSLRRTIDTQ
jgi:DNA adenine methylase